MQPIRSRWLLLAAAFALLPACGKQSSEQSGNGSKTPAKAVLTTVQLLKSGQMDDLLQHVLPPDAYQQVRTRWNAHHTELDQASEAQRKRFAATMQRFTEPGAEKKLWAQVQPKLDQFDKKYKQQLPVTIGVVQLMLGSEINKSDQLTADQKKQAGDLVSALGQWAQQADWGNPDKVKHAIAVITGSARKLDIKTLQQVNALTYKQAMQKYGVVWNGFKQLLDIWGLSIDKTLDSVTAKTIVSDQYKATVQVHYVLLGKPQTLDVQMVKLDNRWYAKDLMDRWYKYKTDAAEAASAAASASAAAPASAASPAISGSAH
jgi:hypothetical protein